MSWKGTKKNNNCTSWSEKKIQTKHTSLVENNYINLNNVAEIEELSNLELTDHADIIGISTSGFFLQIGLKFTLKKDFVNLHSRIA